MRTNKRYLLIANLVVAVVLVATACGTPAPPPAETPPPGDTPTVPAAPTPTTPPAAPKVLRIATSVGCTATSIEEARTRTPCDAMMSQMYNHLTFRNHEGEIEPELATSWELIDDTTWQLKLREGVKFHNGEEFNAEAVKFSFDVAFDPERAWHMTNWALVEEVEVVDDHTVNLHCSEPFPDLPFFAGDFFIMPPEYTQEVGDDGLIADPVGTGPFKFVEFLPGEYLKLEAFDDYWGGRVAIDEVLWEIIPEPATRVAGFQAGEHDMIAMVPMDLVSVVEKDPNLRMEPVNEQMSLIIYLDTFTGGPLDDIRVRKAVDYGIDKETIWETLMGGYGALSGQMLTPGVLGYNPDIEHTAYDPDRARELLDEAGWIDTDGDGVREKDGERLTLDIYTGVGKYLVAGDACIAAAAQLAEVGIEVQVHEVESAILKDYLMNPQKRADMVYIGIYSYGNPAQGMQWFSETHPLHRWKCEECTELFLEARSTIDPDERAALYQRMAEFVAEGTPCVFLMQQPALWAVNNRVVGWRPHPMQAMYLVDTDIQE